MQSQLKHMTITKFNKQFKAIKSQLVYGDIKQISIIAGMERETVSRFINQKGNNINTAIKVLNAANEFLSQREKLIA